MEPGGERPAGLQFDTATPQAGAGLAVGGVTCVGCGRAIENEYFDVNGNTVCHNCREAVASQAETPRGWGVLVRAASLGLVAAVLGALLYYGVVAITKFEIGIVAIAIGYMVGYAVRMGSGGRGGRRFQIMALVLTYWAVGLAYTPLVFRQVASSKTQEAQQERGGAVTPAASSTDSSPEPRAGIARVVVVVLLFTFALPVLAVFSSLPGSLISGAIIAFGMRQAWQMTGAATLQISGPYRIGGRAT